MGKFDFKKYKNKNGVDLLGSVVIFLVVLYPSFIVTFRNDDLPSFWKIISLVVFFLSIRGVFFRKKFKVRFIINQVSFILSSLVMIYCIIGFKIDSYLEKMHMDIPIHEIVNFFDKKAKPKEVVENFWINGWATLYFLLLLWAIIDLLVVFSHRRMNINQSRRKAWLVTLGIGAVEIVVFGGTFLLLKANHDIATALVALLLFLIDEKVGLSLSLFFRRINFCEVNKYRLTGSALNCLLFIKWTSLFLVFGAALGKHFFSKSDDVTLLQVTVTTTALMYLGALLFILIMYAFFNLPRNKKLELVEKLKVDDEEKKVRVTIQDRNKSVVVCLSKGRKGRVYP